MANQGVHKPNLLLRLLEEAEGARTLRVFPGHWNIAYRLLAAFYSLSLIYSVVSDHWTSSDLRGMFIMFVTVMILLRYPAGKKSPIHRPSLIDIVLIVLSIATFCNFIIDYDQMAWRAGSASTRDVVFGIIAIVVVLEACRRALSMILPLLACLLLMYAYFGPYFPGDLFSHQGFSVSQIVGDIYASMNGIFGFVAYVFIAFVMLFVIMGAIFERFGAGRFFIDLPVALFCRFRGGPAKAAVLSSCFFGMISGSATGNVMAVGTFTIPLMKKTGYRPEIAGGIEAAASTGGMFMPPVMGAGAFLMAEMLRIPYSDVVKIALVPALLYFFSILVLVHFEALRSRLGVTPPQDRVSPLKVFRLGWYYMTPIIVLFYVLFTGGTASLAAFYAIASFVIIMAVQYAAGRQLKNFFLTLFNGLVDGADKSLIVASTAGPVGIVVGIVLLSGLAFKFSSLMLAYTFGAKWLALLMVMFTTMLLGMGMTVTADYLIVALLAAPALGQMGIPLVAAHMTAFWYSQSSNVTPPVCMAAFAASSISGAHPYKTGFQAMRLSSYLYMMPFMFVYTDILMLDGFNLDVLWTWLILFASTIPFAAGVIGYLFGDLSMPKRIALVGSSILLIIPSLFSTIASVALLLVVVLPAYLKWKRSVETNAIVYP